MQLTGTRKALRRRIDALRSESGKGDSADDARLTTAVSDPYIWATEYTETYNEHWTEEGRPSAFETFPERLPYLKPLFEVFELERILWIVKFAGHDDFLGLHGVPNLESHDGASVRVSSADAERKKGHPASRVRQVLVSATAPVVT